MKKLAALFISSLLTLAPLATGAVAWAVGPNLVPNPSVEQSSNNQPIGWHSASQGRNTSTYTYQNTGHTGSHSLNVRTTSYTRGDAKWYFTPVSLTPNTNYTYSDWYQSDVATDMDAVIDTGGGTMTRLHLATLPVSSSWRQASASFRTPARSRTLTIYHYIHGVGQLTTDDFSLTADSTPTPPTVNLTAPLNGAVISATQAVSANASDSQGIARVQFKLDGSNLGAADTAAPYSLSWDTTGAVNGNHSLTAVATNTANLSTTSAPVTVDVENQSPPGGNTVPNPSVETSSGGQPQSWLGSNWGTNTAAFSYLNTGHTGTHSLRVDVSAYANGAANWTYTPQAVSAGHYLYTDWYKSNVATEVDAQVTMTDGSTQYFWLGSVPAAANWSQARGEFDVPAGAVSVSIFHLIAANGWLITDDFSFAPYAPRPFNRGLISLTFDDGWMNQYDNALPLLRQYSQIATFYIISGELTDQPDYMGVAQLQAFQAAGSEIASHTITHPDLTTLTQAQVIQEMSQSQATLQSVMGVPVTDFAFPYGAYNANTIAIGQQYYQSQRSVDSGFNNKDNFNITTLKVQNIFNTTTPAQVAAWVNQAIAQKTWLILVYHEIATVPVDPSDIPYTTQPADLSAELANIRSSGIGVVTIHQAINEILPQL